MTETYQTQRGQLLAMNPLFEKFLPPEPPTATGLPALGDAAMRRVLGESVANHAANILVVGWGDGSVLDILLNDALASQKQIQVLIFKGEGTAFAWSMQQPWLERLRRHGVRLTMISDENSIHYFIHNSYRTHEDIPQLAGIDLIDTHPLTTEGQALRQRLHTPLITALMDRPQAYGNDIVDSFNGLYQASINAPLLLPAPSIGEMNGFFGDRPIISIAAGPSVADHLDELRALQDRCVLVACDAVLHGLLDADIDPHFVTPLERVDMILPMLTRAGESRAIYAGLPVCPPAAVRPFAERAIGVYCGDRLYQWLTPDLDGRINSGLSTGVLSVTVASALGTGPVYLVGHDLSKSATSSHWDGAAYAGGDWQRGKTSADTENTVLSGYETRMIPGNDGGQVESIAWWNRFRDEISHEAALMEADHRQMINVNAHDRRFAKIENTHAAPLPDPDAVDILPPITLPAAKPERLREWQERARHLPDDAERLRRHLADLRSDIGQMQAGPPAGWNPHQIADRLNNRNCISDGNRQAFDYFLRSAIHNTNAEMHLRRRTRSTARSNWRMLATIDNLCHALDNALTTLQPQLMEIAHAD
jgi:hypothetical protein